MHITLCSSKLDELFGKSVKNTFICKLYLLKINCPIIFYPEKNQNIK